MGTFENPQFSPFVPVCLLWLLLWLFHSSSLDEYDRLRLQDKGESHSGGSATPGIEAMDTDDFGAESAAGGSRQGSGRRYTSTSNQPSSCASNLSARRDEIGMDVDSEEGDGGSSYRTVSPSPAGTVGSYPRAENSRGDGVELNQDFVDRKDTGTGHGRERDTGRERGMRRSAPQTVTSSRVHRGLPSRSPHQAHSQSLQRILPISDTIRPAGSSSSSNNQLKGTGCTHLNLQRIDKILLQLQQDEMNIQLCITD